MVRMAGWWARSEMDRGPVHELPTKAVPAGDVFGDEVVFLKDQTYVLTVHPREYPCRAAVVRVGTANEVCSEEEIVAKLLSRAKTVGAGETRRIENIAKPGRYAWGVWHDELDPVHIFAIFLDSRDSGN